MFCLSFYFLSSLGLQSKSRIFLLIFLLSFISGCSSQLGFNKRDFAKRKYFSYTSIKGHELLSRKTYKNHSNSTVVYERSGRENDTDCTGLKLVESTWCENSVTAESSEDQPLKLTGRPVNSLVANNLGYKAVSEFPINERLPNPISPPPDPPEWLAPLSLLFGLLAVPLVFYSLPLAIAGCVLAITLGLLGLKAPKLGFLASIGLVLGFVAFFLLTIVGIFYLSVFLAF